MEDEIREKAEKNFKYKQAFYVVATTFAAVSIILFVVSLTLVSVKAKFWVLFPILVLTLVLGIVYVSMFGFSLRSFSNRVEWEEEEIEKEMNRIYRQRKNEMPAGEELSDEDVLELKELERLKRKWYDYDDFV